MSLINSIKSIDYGKITLEARILYALIGFIFLLGTILIVINTLTTGYSETIFFSSSWQKVLLPLLALSAVVVYFQDILSERVGLVMFTFSMYCLSLCAGLVLTQGGALTPFTPIDPQLLHVDRLLGFNQIGLMHFAYGHSAIKHTLITAYNSLEPELVILPLLMAFMLRERSVKVFLYAMLLTYPIGIMIYYFFPTMAPASTIHSALFTFQEHDTYIHFFETHHHLKITAVDGGLVAFPSFHVIWGTLLIYLCRDKKYIFYPVLLWNAILIGSTMALGWHYLTDVVAGLTIAASCIYFSECIYKRVKQNYLITRKCGRSFLAGGLVSGGESLPPSPPVSSSLKTMPRPFSYE